LVLFLGFLVETDGDLREVLRLGHKLVHSFAALEEVLEILVHDALHFEQFFFDFQQLVRLVGILPLLEDGFEGWKLELSVSSDLR